jgi:signal transduction histidine kinase/sensor domain CHASE-containing protein
MDVGPRQTLDILPYGKQNYMAFLGAVITFAILTLILWQFSIIYQDNLMAEQQSQVEMQLFSYGNTLTNHISQDITYLEGVDTFVQENPSKYHLYNDFDLFAFGLYSGAHSIYSIQLFPTSNEVYVYPGSDNMSFMGNSYDYLINNEGFKVRADVQRAIQTRQITISGPYDLQEGGTVLVAMQAIYIEDSLWGIAVIAIDMQPLLRNAGLYDTPENMNIALRASSGQMFVGSRDTFEMGPRTYNIGLPEGSLELAAVPAAGWSASIKEPLSIFQKGGFVIVLLLSLLVYILLNHYGSLKSKVRQRTVSLNEVSSIAHIGGWDIDISSGKSTWTPEMARIHDVDPDIDPNVEFCMNFYLPASRHTIEKAFRNAIDNGMPYDLELEIVSAKGVRKWVRSLGQPVIENGKVVKLTGSIQDITELKKAEEKIRKLNAELEQRVIERTSQLEAANKELEAFTYSVSHDLRAPLRAIDGFSRILTEDYESVFDDEAKRLFEIIRTNTKKMDKLITDLLSLSRIGKNEMNCVEIDMTSMVRSIFIDLVMYKEENNFVFTVADLPHICADSTLIRQLWINLLSNAIKFSMKGEDSKIEVDAYAENGMNVYYIKDNGVGFDPKYSKKLFGIFQRLHNEKEFEGTGVGLAIVQRIVHRHGGKIWAEGKLGEDATFYFSLPLKEEEHVCGE